MADIERHRQRLDVDGKVLAKDALVSFASGTGGTFFLTHGTAVKSSGKSRTGGRDYV